MGEEVKKGVVVEFDFAAMDGAELLYKTTEQLLTGIEVPFNRRVEAQYLAGGNYQGGLAEYFAVVKTKKTAAKAAKDLSEAFAAAVAKEIPKALTPAFSAFVKTLAENNVKVVIATRANVEAVAPMFEGLLSENVVLFQEVSQTYGSIKWDAWRRACVQNGLKAAAAVAVTGTGFGVKSALLAGMPSIAVIRDNVAYQDFGGTDEAVKALDADAAKIILSILRIA